MCCWDEGLGKNIIQWVSLSILLMVIFTLCIHKFNIIDGKVRRQFKERFHQQLYKKHYKVCYQVVMDGEVGEEALI